MFTKATDENTFQATPLVKMTTGNQNNKPSQFDVIKEFPPRGALQQFRLDKVTTFSCNRCGKQKTAKLVATKYGDWSSLVCNSCYGWLLSNSAQGPSQSSGPRLSGVAGSGGDRGRNKGGIQKRKGRSGKKTSSAIGGGDH
ncbi:hypothetical protein B0H67DRAFT_307113 [Lasiosphaeris hirsuta]|uniref:Uncharacterized protein n=1 Tax=Lasiosphaeris hirsuta TaxID=260670 RepID=A0AA40DPF0_9PEZI|nr:hypothetical protein B0H67DRAFT_307113 [Lasiosphaeris hirsuta]